MTINKTSFISMLLILCLTVGLAAQTAPKPKPAEADSKTVRDEHASIGIEAGKTPGSSHTMHPDAQWYPDAGLGLFLHWGISSVRAMNISWPMRPGRALAKAKLTPEERDRVIRENDYNLDGKPFTIIHSLDGYDEISLTNDTKVITNNGEQLKTPEELGKRFVEPQSIYGGNSPEEAAKIFLKIIKGEGTWAQNAVVFANAAMALQCTGMYKMYDDAYKAAVESLESGKAFGSLQKLISLQ